MAYGWDQLGDYRPKQIAHDLSLAGNYTVFSQGSVMVGHFRKIVGVFIQVGVFRLKTKIYPTSCKKKIKRLL